jgi:hypothetical protein
MDDSTQDASGGRCEIRTHGAVAGTPVFKTGALDHSANLPVSRRLWSGHAAMLSHWKIITLPPFTARRAEWGHRYASASPGPEPLKPVRFLLV